MKVKGENIDDEKELFNYKKAMDYASRYVKVEEPVTEDIIRDIHKLLQGLHSFGSFSHKRV